MNICRCPYCQSTFQVNIPPDSDFWDRTPVDEDGLAQWVCLDCHRQGLPSVDAATARQVGHDTSYRHHGAEKA